MIKTIRYCDICGREQHKNYDVFYQMLLPRHGICTGDIILSEEESDICKQCLTKLYWKINELRHPNRKCPD